jgi:hypothetical protein
VRCENTEQLPWPPVQNAEARWRQESFRAWLIGHRSLVVLTFGASKTEPEARQGPGPPLHQVRLSRALAQPPRTDENPRVK